MKVRVLSSLLCLAALSMVMAIVAQETPKSTPVDKKNTEIRDNATLEERLIQQQFRDFQEQVLKLKQRLERSPRLEDRERALVLEKVLETARDLSISTQFEKVISDLRKDNFNNLTELQLAAEKSKKLADDLQRLVDLIKQDGRTQKLQNDAKALQELIKKIDQLIQDQKTVQAQVDRNLTDPKELRNNQKSVTDRTADVAKALDGKNNKGGEAKDQKGNPKDSGKEGGKQGESKDQGKGNEGKKGETKDQGKESKPGEGKPGEAKPGADKKDPSKAGEGKQGEAKPGKDSDGKKAESKGSKGGEGKPGEAKESKGGEGGKDGEKKEGGAKDEGKKTGGVKEKKAEAKGQDDKKDPAKKPGEDKQGEAKAGPKNSDSKPAGAKESKPGSESKPGDPKSGGEPKQGEAKPGEKSKGQGQAKSGGDPMQPMPQGPQPSPKGDPSQKPPSPSDNPATGKVKEAEEKMKQAEEKIAGKDPKEASDKQGQAIKDLEAAKKKLEDLLRQLREEEKERVLAALIQRCEKMLAMQLDVLAGTEQLMASIQKNDDKKPTQPNRVESARLSDREKDIVNEATKALEIIEAEGTAVAFPVVFEQVREDMKHVQRRLDVTDAGPVTQAIEKDIVDTLKEMIEALKKAKQDMDNKKSEPKPSEPKQSGPPPDPKLLEQIAELKMIRSMQLRVNNRTETYGKMYQGEQAAVPAVREEVIKLHERQIQIFEITNKIAKGDNK